MIYKIDRRTMALLLGILLVAGTLRIYGLDYHSFRNDELSSWNRSNFDTFSEVIEVGVRPDPHPPGWQYIVWVLDQNVGDSQVILRSPSAIAGILAVLAIFILGVRLYGKYEGIVAASLMAISAAPIYYSHDARSNSLLILCCTISLFFLWKLIRGLKDESRLDLGAALGFVLTNAAACYLHYFGVVAFGMQSVYLFGVAALTRESRHILSAMAIPFAVALLYMPWWAGFFEDLTVAKAAWIPRPGKTFPMKFLHFSLSSSWLLAWATVGLLLYLFVTETRRLWLSRHGFNLLDEVTKADFFLAFYFLGIFVLVVVKSWISEPVASLRNMVILFPVVYLLIARGLARLPITQPVRNLGVLAFLLLSAYQLIYGIQYYSTPQKQQFREAVAYVINNDRNDPLLPVAGFAWHRAYFDYYFERLGGTHRVSTIAGLAEHEQRIADMLVESDANRFWYILAGTPPADPTFLENLHARYELVDEAALFRATVWLFEDKQSVPATEVPE